MKHNAYLPKNISGSIFSLVKSTIFLICSFKLIFVQLFFWMIFKIFTHLFFWRKLNFRSCALLCMNMRVIVEYGIECAISYPFLIFFQDQWQKYYFGKPNVQIWNRSTNNWLQIRPRKWLRSYNVQIAPIFLYMHDYSKMLLLLWPKLKT